MADTNNGGPNSQNPGQNPNQKPEQNSNQNPVQNPNQPAQNQSQNTAQNPGQNQGQNMAKPIPLPASAPAATSASKPANSTTSHSTSSPANPNNNIVRNWLSGIAAVLVILIGITYIVHRNDNATLASSTGTSTIMAATTTAITTSSSEAFTPIAGTLMTASQGEAVAASDQPAGSSVAIGSMTLARTSWVAVVASNGSILGAALFPASATNGTIPLERDTVAGNTYRLVIYADNGDKIFEFHKDLLVMSNDDAPVSATFMAQ